MVTGQPTDFAERVLGVAENIPPGRVMSYGDIAEYLGEKGPRQVGRVMALWGGGVAGDPRRRFVPGRSRTGGPGPLPGRGHPAAPYRGRRGLRRGHAPRPLA